MGIMTRSVKTTWRRLAVWALAAPLAISACATRAVALDVEVGEGSNFQMQLLVGSAVEVKVTNTGRRAAKRVMLSCQFFDAAGATVMTGVTYFSDLGAGRTDINKVILATPGVARGDCAVR